MKKTALFFLISILSTNAFAEQQTANEIGLNTPVRWYAKALSNAIFSMHYKNNQDVNGAEQASEISKAFLQILNIKDGVVLLSPAEFIEKCMSVYQVSDASTKCSDAMIDAVHKHNELSRTFTAANILSTSDMNTKIKWNFRVWYSALSQILDLDIDPLANTFSDYMNSVNNIASLNEWLTECNRAIQYISSSNEPYLKDAGTRLQSHNFTCQKYIETLVKTHNEYTKAYGSEKIINYKRTQNEQI